MENQQTESPTGTGANMPSTSQQADESQQAAGSGIGENMDEMKITLLLDVKIPAGPDNHTEKELRTTIEQLQGYENGLSRAEVIDLLVNLMRTPPNQPIPFTVLGPTEEEGIVYAIPAIKAIAYDEGEGGLGEPQPKPQQETKFEPLFENDVFKIINTRAGNDAYRGCKHGLPKDKGCRLGRCTVQRKDYLEACFKYPLTFNKDTRTFADYQNKEANREAENRRTQKTTRRGKRMKRKLRVEAEEPKEKGARVATIKVPYHWTKHNNPKYKGIFTYLTVVRAGYDYCVVRVNANYRNLTKTQWHAAGFGELHKEPGQFGILFGSRKHQCMKRDHKRFLEYNGAIYSDDGTTPIYKANDVEMNYYSHILDLEDDRYKNLPWSAILTVGMQIQAEIVPAETYGVDGYEPGAGMPSRPNGWPTGDTPLNWAVKNFRLIPVSVAKTLQQPVVYKNFAYITQVITFGKHWEHLFAISKSKPARTYGAEEVARAREAKQTVDFDMNRLPPEELENYSFYRLGRPPKANDIHHILVTAGVPPHSTCYRPSTKTLDDMLEQMDNTRLWTHEGFSHSATPDELNRDFASGNLTAVEHKIPGYMVRDAYGGRLIGGTDNVRLIDEPCIYTSTFHSGMPTDFQKEPCVHPINCTMGRPALATLAWAKAPQSDCPEEYRWPQLNGLEREDKRVVMQRAVLSTELICAIRQEQKESNLQFAHIDVRTRGLDTDLKIECLLPVDNETKQSVFRFSTDVGKPVRLRSWDKKVESLQGLNLLVTKTYPAYRFKQNPTQTRAGVINTTNMNADPGQDPFNHNNIRYTANTDTPDNFPNKCRFGWRSQYSIQGVEFEDFRLPKGEAGSYWEYVGTVIQMTSTTPNQRASVMGKEIFTQHRFFILQHGRSEIMRCALAALSPLTHAKSLDRNHKQFKVRTDKYKELQKRQAVRDKEREEQAKNTKGARREQLKRLAEDQGTGELVGQHVLNVQFQTDFKITHAMPRCDLWKNADLMDPENENTHPAPKNLLYLGVLSAMALKYRMPDRFPPEQSKILERRDYLQLQKALFQNGYPHKPSKAQMEIAIRALTGRVPENRDRQPIIVALGPPGTGKTSACEFTTRALITYNRHNYPDGYTPREDCHASYRKGPTNKTNIPVDDMAILLIAESNFAVDRACEGIVGNYFTGPTLSDKYSYFREREDSDVRILRHYSFKNKVKSEKSSVKDATFDAITMYHEGPNCPSDIKEMRKSIKENSIKIDQLLVTIGEKHKKNQQTADEEKEVAALSATNRQNGLQMWDRVLDTCSIDVLACTGAMLCDIRLRHPKLAFHTVIVEEFSQVMTAHVLQAIDLLDTRFKDPCIIFFGDNKQMPVTTSLRGRLKAMAELNCVDVMMDPKNSILKALQVDPKSWRNWGLPEPMSVVDPVRLDIQYRMNEVLSAFIAHNIYTDKDKDPLFVTAEHLRAQERRTYDTPGERTTAGVNPDVRVGLWPHSKMYDLCHFPWPALGKQLMNVDVVIGREEDKVTSKTHQKMVELAMRMIEFYVHQERGILAKDITILTAYDALRQDVERELIDNLHRHYGEFTGKEYVQAKVDADNNIITEGYWREELTKFSDIEVCNLTGYQGRENRMIFFINPRMANKQKKERMQAAEFVPIPESRTGVENWPVIDFEKVKELPQLVANALGYMDDETKMVVAGSRASSAYIVIQNVTTTDFSQCWNKFNQASINGGFYLTNPMQLFQDAKACSHNPICWYWGSDACMQEPGGLDFQPEPIEMELTDQVIPYEPVNTDIETRPRHEDYVENFFRKPIDLDWLMRKTPNGDIEPVQIPNPRKDHNKYARSCWSVIRSEKPASFTKWKGKLTATNWTDMATANIAAEDEFGEGATGELTEEVINKRREQSEKILEEIEKESRDRISRTEESLELQIATAESMDAPNQYEFYPDFQFKGDSLEDREDEMKAEDPMKKIKKMEVLEEMDEEEENKQKDVVIIPGELPTRLRPDLQTHVKAMLEAFSGTIGAYSHPLFEYYIELYINNRDEFPTIKLPNNWEQLRNLDLWGRCENLEMNAVYINEMRKTEVDDVRRRDPHFQLLCFDIIKRRLGYQRLKDKGLTPCSTERKKPHISPYKRLTEGGYDLVEKDDTWDRLKHLEEERTLQVKIIAEDPTEETEEDTEMEDPPE